MEISPPATTLELASSMGIFLSATVVATFLQAPQDSPDIFVEKFRVCGHNLSLCVTVLFSSLCQRSRIYGDQNFGEKFNTKKNISGDHR